MAFPCLGVILSRVLVVIPERNLRLFLLARVSTVSVKPI